MDTEAAELIYPENGGEFRAFLPVLPSPSASPYHVAVAGRHSVSTAALPFAADFPPSNSNAAEAVDASSRMQSRKGAEEAIGDGLTLLVPFPFFALPLLFLAVLASSYAEAAWTGVLVDFFLGALRLFYGFEKSQAPMLRASLPGWLTLYKWQHSTKGGKAGEWGLMSDGVAYRKGGGLIYSGKQQAEQRGVCGNCRAHNRSREFRHC